MLPLQNRVVTEMTVRSRIPVYTALIQVCTRVTESLHQHLRIHLLHKTPWPTALLQQHLLKRPPPTMKMSLGRVSPVFDVIYLVIFLKFQLPRFRRIGSHLLFATTFSGPQTSTSISVKNRRISWRAKTGAGHSAVLQSEHCARQTEQTTDEFCKKRPRCGFQSGKIF